MKLFAHGLIVGKFMPLHKGHLHLIDTALQQSAHMTICLMSRNDEPIPGAIRLVWLKKLYNDQPITIVHHTAELPQDSSGYGHWNEYLASLLTVCTDTYDAVFSSEAYGERLAQDLTATHVMVDEARKIVPVSGREIRNDPTAFSDYIPESVQEYFEQE